MFLKRVEARAIKDSRGEPTIEVRINNAKASAPAGKSTGKYETPPYHNSLQWNINFLNSTSFDLEINSFHDLIKLEFLIIKKTKLKNVKQFGANALVALEISILKALAREQKKQLWQVVNDRAKKLPVPVGNSVEGGLHAHNPSHPNFQEFLLIPKEKTFSRNYFVMKKIYTQIGKILKSRMKTDEGAWQTSLPDFKILEILSHFKNVRIGTDIAASSFYKKNFYEYKNSRVNRKNQINYINSLIKKFDLFYTEDPIHEEDFAGFSKVTRSTSNLVVGDDLTATQIDRLKKAISNKSINAMIVKPNQNGSLLEVKKIIDLCRKNGIKTVFSHRSGETLDDALADLAFGFQTDFIKCGISTKWREVKLKRLCEIEKSCTKFA